MYDASIAIQCKMHNVSMYLRAYYTMPATRWNVIRYLLASHYIFYWSLRRRMFDWKNDKYKNADPGSFADLCEDQLIPNGVLIKQEAEALKAYKGNKHKMLYSWSIIALKRIMQTSVPSGEKGNPMLQSQHEQTALVNNLKQEIVELRGSVPAPKRISISWRSSSVAFSGRLA